MLGLASSTLLKNAVRDTQSAISTCEGVTEEMHFMASDGDVEAVKWIESDLSFRIQLCRHRRRNYNGSCYLFPCSQYAIALVTL